LIDGRLKKNGKKGSTSAIGKKKLLINGQFVSNHVAPFNTSRPDIAVGAGFGANVTVMARS